MNGRAKLVCLISFLAPVASCGDVNTRGQGGGGKTEGPVDAEIARPSSKDAGSDVVAVADARDAPTMGKDVAMDVWAMDRPVPVDRGPPTDATSPVGGLVLHWTFDENSGTEVKDSSGNGLDGTLAARSGQPLPAWAPGMKGAAVEFNNMVDPYLQQWVELPNSDTHGLLDLGPTEDLTVSLWINNDVIDPTGHDAILEKKEHGGSYSQPGYGLHVAADARLVGFLGDGTHNLYMPTTRTNLVPARTGWHHVVMVLVRGSLAESGIYVDGAWEPVMQWEYYVQNDVELKRPATPLTGSLASPLPFKVGIRSNQCSYFNGAIDEVRIYNRALTSGEVQALYTNP